MIDTTLMTKEQRDEAEHQLMVNGVVFLKVDSNSVELIKPEQVFIEHDEYVWEPDCIEREG